MGHGRRGPGPRSEAGSEKAGVRVRGGERGNSTMAWTVLLLMLALLAGVSVFFGVQDGIGDRLHATVCKIGRSDDYEPATWQNDKADEDAPRQADSARQAAIHAKVRRILGQSPTGKRARDFLDKNRNIKVVYRPKHAEFFDPSNETIYVSTNWGEQDRAFTVIHEATHAEYHVTGRTANDGRQISRLPRSEYVDRRLDEEVEAKIREIVARQEMRRACVRVHATYGFDVVYRKAYEKAVATAAGPLSTAAKKEIGQRAGRKAVKDRYGSGRVKSSRTGETYAESFGAFWDRVNKKRPARVN
jgi:hypothetical protein